MQRVHPILKPDRKAQAMRYRADVLKHVSLPNGQVDLDEHGYITDPSKWTPDFARYVADQEGITLTDDHWQVLDFMRAYYDDHGIMADARFIFKYLSARDNTDKTGAKHILFELFPYGYVKQAVKMAGMKQPRAWSTG